jgi:hypothetical protein
MSNESTKKMLSMYNERKPAPMFLASLFTSPQENFHNSESVEIDIERGEEDVAIAVKDLSTGYHLNTTDLYVSKEFIPPLFKEGFRINAFKMIKRQPGQNPFQDPNYQANAMSEFTKELVNVTNLIRRAVEWQCSQVLQTGTVTLIDENGNAVYTIDYKPKATHFPTAGTAWTAASPTIVADLESLMDVIRDDGKEDPAVAIFGQGSFTAALNNDDFLKLFDTRRVNLGSIEPMVEIGGQGGKYRGRVDIGAYPLDIWTYNGKYRNPQTLVKTKYVEDDKVIIMAPNGRRELTWGNVPIIVRPEQRVMPFVPPRISVTGAGGVDIITNVWTTDDGEQVLGGANARPLAIPVAIDTHGCLDTNI